MTETSSYQALAAALRERIEVIRDREFFAHDPTGHLARLQSVSATIVTLQAHLPEPVHPQLAHYLQRCSYEKALEFIESRTE